MTDVLTTLKRRAPARVVTAKRRETVALAFSYLPLERFFDVVVGSDDTERHKPDPAPLVHALELLGAAATTRSTSATRPSTSAPPRAPECTRSRSRGAHPPAERLEAEEPDDVVDTAEELLAAL
jgi:pyrophosphatase PpaX